jgi:hypothetical protein
VNRQLHNAVLKEENEVEIRAEVIGPVQSVDETADVLLAGGDGMCIRCV